MALNLSNLALWRGQCLHSQSTDNYITIKGARYQATGVGTLATHTLSQFGSTPFWLSPNVSISGVPSAPSGWSYVFDVRTYEGGYPALCVISSSANQVRYFNTSNNKVLTVFWRLVKSS